MLGKSIVIKTSSCENKKMARESGSRSFRVIVKLRYVCFFLFFLYGYIKSPPPQPSPPKKVFELEFLTRVSLDQSGSRGDKFGGRGYRQVAKRDCQVAAEVKYSFFGPGEEGFSLSCYIVHLTQNPKTLREITQNRYTLLPK